MRWWWQILQWLRESWHIPDCKETFDGINSTWWLAGYEGTFITITDFQWKSGAYKLESYWHDYIIVTTSQWKSVRVDLVEEWREIYVIKDMRTARWKSLYSHRDVANRPVIFWALDIERLWDIDNQYNDRLVQILQVDDNELQDVTARVSGSEDAYEPTADEEDAYYRKLAADLGMSIEEMKEMRAA